MFVHGVTVAHHGKNPVWFVFHCMNKLQSQPTGFRKFFIDHFFFQGDQWDCTKSLLIFNQFASSEERLRTSLPNLSFVSFPTRGLGWFVNQRNPSGYWQVKGGDLGQIISFYVGFFPFMILFCLGLTFSLGFSSVWLEEHDFG